MYRSRPVPLTMGMQALKQGKELLPSPRQIQAQAIVSKSGSVGNKAGAVGRPAGQRLDKFTMKELATNW